MPPQTLLLYAVFLETGMRTKTVGTLSYVLGTEIISEDLKNTYRTAHQSAKVQIAVDSGLSNGIVNDKRFFKVFIK